MTDKPESPTPGGTGRLVRDVAVYTLARLALVVALTALIFFAARLFGITEIPIVVAMLFAIVISLPLSMWTLAPLRRRATESIAAVDERRRRDRADLQARLRGEQQD